MMRTEPCSRGEMNKMAVKMTQIEAEPRKLRLCPKVPRGLAHGVVKNKFDRAQKNAPTFNGRSGNAAQFVLTGFISSFETLRFSVHGDTSDIIYDACYLFYISIGCSGAIYYFLSDKTDSGFLHCFPPVG